MPEKEPDEAVNGPMLLSYQKSHRRNALIMLVNLVSISIWLLGRAVRRALTPSVGRNRQ